MIIRFSVENWMSFSEPVEFSMLASKEKQHKDRLAVVNKYPARILPIAAIYGGNASGKTNFFKALNFVKTFVVSGSRPDALIPVEPFRLDSGSMTSPSRFTIEILVEETIYEFTFAVTRKTVFEETLVKITSSSEKTLYARKDGSISFESSLEDDLFLKYAFQGTRDNQLFLTNAVSQKVSNFQPIYNWFKDTLEMVAPDSRFEPFEQFLDEKHPLFSNMSAMLPQLDTGITHLGGEDVPFDSIAIPEPLKLKLQEDVKEGNTVRLLYPFNERYLITRKDGELAAKKLVSYHRNKDGTESKFEMRLESDGTQRVIDLLPAFLEIVEPKSSKVYVVDELDRSLHTLLTRQLLEAYLLSCNSASRSQLLFTTHDALLLDQDLFRRDEIWVAERDKDGSSTLVSFSEYKDVRYDKDIRKSYLQGRLGGVPRIFIDPGLTGTH